MHEAVTKSTKNLHNITPDDGLQTPISRNQRHFTTDDLAWSNHNSESSSENWPLSATNELPPSLLNIAPRVPAGLGKKSSPSNMPTRTENSSSDLSIPSGNRWRFNVNGQLVDSETTNWDLANEIVRLKISEVTGSTEDVHEPISTQHKQKINSIAQINQTSPLETSSNTSAGSSPQPSEHDISISHSRGSSTDTTISSSQESVGSGPGAVLLAKPPLSVNTGVEAKGRPHSFSGGLSTADLRRLQQAGDDPDSADRQQRSQGQYRENMNATADQLSYPSLMSHIHRPQPQPHPQLYDYRASQSQPVAADHEDLQLEYNNQQRHFNAHSQGQSIVAPPGPSFHQRQPNNNIPPGFRLPPRGYPNIVANPPTMGYPGHASHLSLGNTQQLYDMMLPAPHDGHHPAVARVQQQHNAFRPTHHHSASDPSAAIRDAANIALMNNNMQSFAPGMFQPNLPAMPMYPNQYYAAQEQYPISDPMASRLQPQYTGQYAVLPPQNMIMRPDSASSPTSTNSHGPSANNRKLGLYKTELCRSWEEKGTCRYGTKCQFAHGEEELRKVSRHPKYKTEICRTFWVSGTCPYGKRCCFIHTELPASGVAGATGGGTPVTDNTLQQRPDGRSRSLSTNSDPNEATVSLLARISGKRTQEPNNLATPVDGNSFQFTRPPTGSLRVDTSALDTSIKQNKSAYPTFTSNGILLPAPEPVSQKSPAPVTAGPDLGRHSNARREIVGYNNQRSIHKTNASTSSNAHHSFNGSEADLNFSPSPSAPNAAPGHSSFTLSSDGATRPNGHVRGGSAGNWGSISRNSHLSQSAYPNSSSPVGEITGNSPWTSAELAMGSSRLHEKVWA